MVGERPGGFVDAMLRRWIKCGAQSAGKYAIRPGAGVIQKLMMATEKTVKTALEALSQALKKLEDAVDRQVESGRSAEEAGAELARMLEDRSRLAQELDRAEDRSNRLEEANREVSRRLVTAMETIRAVLDR